MRKTIDQHGCRPVRDSSESDGGSLGEGRETKGEN